MNCETEIINKITFEQGFALAKAIDDCAVEAFKIPKWLFRHRLLLQIYADWKRLEIRQTTAGAIEFWKEGRPKAKLQIINKISLF
jgi:hypothetical protein